MIGSAGSAAAASIGAVEDDEELVVTAGALLLAGVPPGVLDRPLLDRSTGSGDGEAEGAAGGIPADLLLDREVVAWPIGVSGNRGDLSSGIDGRSLLLLLGGLVEGGDLPRTATAGAGGGGGRGGSPGGGASSMFSSITSTATSTSGIAESFCLPNSLMHRASSSLTARDWTQHVSCDSDPKAEAAFSRRIPTHSMFWYSSESPTQNTNMV